MHRVAEGENGALENSKATDFQGNDALLKTPHHYQQDHCIAKQTKIGKLPSENSLQINIEQTSQTDSVDNIEEKRVILVHPLLGSEFCALERFKRFLLEHYGNGVSSYGLVTEERLLLDGFPVPENNPRNRCHDIL